MSHNSENFSRLRDIFWPIGKTELKMFLPMAMLMTCILFNLGILKSLKDSLIVANIGAEAISFLKLFIVLPVAIIFTLIYVKLSNTFSLQKVFYIVVSSFIVMFFIFGYLLYPNHLAYHPSNELIDRMILSYPYFKWLIKLFSQWSSVLIYLLAELWSVVVINLMFWQFANHNICTTKAKRFYPFLSMVGNSGLFIAGNVLLMCSDNANLPSFITNNLESICNTDEELTIKLIVVIISISGIISMLLLRYVSNVIELNQKEQGVQLPARTKLSLKQSLKLILHSRYIGYITLIVICYSITINVVESCWKSKIKMLYPTMRDYMSFMGHFNIWMGISSVAFTLLSSQLLRKYKWKYSAYASPILIGTTGGIFFSLIVFLSNSNYQVIQPILLAVMVGAGQNIISKATKYSLFDVSKEMTYIPLSIELRTKGKAAVEVVGNKFGKSLGATIQAGIFTLMPSATFDSAAPWLMNVFVIMIIIWFIAIQKLSREYNNLIGKNNETS